MNGPHDVGGTHGYGPVAIERNEPVFHQQWEAEVFAALLAVLFQGVLPADENRHVIETMGNVLYATSSYYERWLVALETVLVRKGLIDGDEYGRRVQDVRRNPKRFEPLPTGGRDVLAQRLMAIIETGGSSQRDDGPPPRFRVDNGVRTKVMNPAGHTRLPRYARGKRGTVVAVNGNHVFPDTNAHGLGEQPRPLYTVRFEGRELWGEAHDLNDLVHLDIWEPHLEAA